MGQEVTNLNTYVVDKLHQVYKSSEVDKLIVTSLDGIFSLMAAFNRHKFFTKELYKKALNKCEINPTDKSEIQAAFIIKFLYNSGIYVIPCGAAWCAPHGKEEVENYLKKFTPIFSAYETWCEKQR